MILGSSLQKGRMKSGMRQEDAAKELGISRQRLSSWERDGSEPDLEMVMKMAELYGMTLDELLESNFSGQSAVVKENSHQEKQKSFWEQYVKEIALVCMFFCMLTASPQVCWIGVIYNLIVLICYPRKNLERKQYWLLKGMALIGVIFCMDSIRVLLM